MWSRSIIKSNAKEALGGKYFYVLAVCAIVAVINYIPQFLPLNANIDYTGVEAQSALYYEKILEQVFLSLPLFFITTLYGIFIGYPLAIGSARFFVRNRFGSTGIRNVFSGFKDGWGSSTAAMFVTELITILWSLLLIIPGIVKSLEYCMVPYILSDNPHLPGGRAREISRAMTEGEKGSIFVFVLSFAGWFILAAIAGAIVVSAGGKTVGSILIYVGCLFVAPYFEASFTELYIFLRDRAIRNNMASPYELGLAADPQNFSGGAV
jgi:uncharacterized membrane protein